MSDYEDYEPEIGQMLFGNGWQPHKVQYEVEQVMDALQGAFSVLYPKLDNPFSNSGARYRWSCFEVHSYDWGDDEQPFNFKWRDFSVSWYKYNGRGMSQNRKIMPFDLRTLFQQCMGAMLNEQAVDIFDV